MADIPWKEIEDMDKSQTEANREHLTLYLHVLRVSLTLLEAMDRHPGEDRAAQQALLKTLSSALEGASECVLCRWADDQTRATAQRHSPEIREALKVCQQVDPNHQNSERK